MPNNNAMYWALDVRDAWEWALTFIGDTMADAGEEEMARVRDEAEARKAVEEALRISDDLGLAKEWDYHSTTL
jgi:hypothetical protein